MGNNTKDQKEGLEFNFQEYKEIDSYCKSIKIEWFASAWDIESLKFLDQFTLIITKFSPMIVDKNFLEEVAKRKNIHLYQLV